MAASLTQCWYSILGGDNAQQEIQDYEIPAYEDDFDYLKYFTVVVEAQFECSKCNFKWCSHNVTIKIDLIRRCISKKYRQKCKRCNNYWALPRIRSDKLKGVIERIIKHRQKMEEAKCFLAFGTEQLTPDHSEEYCERCNELSKPCYLEERNSMQIKLDCSPVTSIFRQVPHVMASYIEKHLHLLKQVLEEMRVKVTVHTEDQSGFIHIIPTKKSRKIQDWNRICENKLVTFLKSLDSQSLSVQPELLPGLEEVIKEIKSDPSLHVEEQTLFQIAGKSQEVRKTLENIQQKKPCILPF